jgi:hypothetical protein
MDDSNGSDTPPESVGESVSGRMRRMSRPDHGDGRSHGPHDPIWEIKTDSLATLSESPLPESSPSSTRSRGRTSETSTRSPSVSLILCLIIGKKLITAFFTTTCRTVYVHSLYRIYVLLAARSLALKYRPPP